VKGDGGALDRFAVGTDEVEGGATAGERREGISTRKSAHEISGGNGLANRVEVSFVRVTRETANLSRKILITQGKHIMEHPPIE